MHARRTVHEWSERSAAGARSSRRSRSVHTLGFLAVAMASTLMTAVASGAGPHDESSRHLIVRFRAEGPYALHECAESLLRTHRSFASAAADGSDSLDALNARVAVRGMRAIFRKPDGRPLREQRARLRARIERRLPRGRPAGAHPLPDVAHVYRVEIGADVPLAEAVGLYARDPHVVWAQADHTHGLDTLPDDPFLLSSGSWGQPFEDLWGLHRIRAPGAWAITQGEGALVAVVDTGVDYLHPDIASNVWVNPGEDLDGNGRVDEADWNGEDDDGNGFVDDLRGYDFAGSLDVDRDGRWDGPDDEVDADPFDENGHGTHVAGIIAAIADNGIGVAGVAPRATILPVKGFPAEGPGIDSVLWRAVLYAAENGADVVNNSWSCLPECPENPLAEDVVELVHAMGVVVVTSAGNLQRDVVRNSPESSNRVVTVASSGQDDAPSRSFTNTGWLLDVAAPGGGGPDVIPGVRVARRNILSLRSSADHDSEAFAVASDYLRNAGTSMAAPHVSGVVALLRSRRPGLEPDAVRRILRETARDLGPPGHDRSMGAGRVDAWAALVEPPLPDLDAAITGPRPGVTFSPADGPIRISGRAAGRDLAWWSLRFGRGSDPATWVPIVTASDAEVRDDVLAEWDPHDQEPGAYVLRLDVYGRDGRQYEEFLPLSLEPGRFEPISGVGPDARAPDVSGRLAVWQSRRNPARSEVGATDLNLFVTDLVTGEIHVIQSANGDQKSASISSSPPVVAWLDERDDVGIPRAYACALEPRTGHCAEIAVSSGAVVAMPPASVAGLSVWVEERGGVPDLRACRVDAKRRECRPEALGLGSGRRSLVTSDGERLVWTDFSNGQRFGTCAVHRGSARCIPTLSDSPIFAWSRGTASQGLLAWVGFDLMGDLPLQICELDPDTGACAPIRVVSGITDQTPDLSGHRLVWDGHVGDEEGDVFFCEYDAVRARCPVQRLTAQMDVQRASSIDGRWVVWEDDRDGPVRIYGTLLPGFDTIADRRVREGQSIRVPVRVRTGWPDGRESIRIVAESVGDRTLADLGMRFVDRGRGRGRLSWRPSRGMAGHYAVTFAATTREQIVTRHTMRIEVVEPARPSRESGWWRALEELLVDLRSD